VATASEDADSEEVSDAEAPHPASSAALSTKQVPSVIMFLNFIYISFPIIQAFVT